MRAGLKCPARTFACVILRTRLTYFNAATETWLGKEHITEFSDKGVTEYARDSDDMAGAAFVSFMPTGGWLDGDQLSAMWKTSEDAWLGGAFEVDAMLYTNNATMFLVRKSSGYGGSAIINGGLIGSDMGILIPGDGGVGLQLNYDKRHKGVVRLRETGTITMVRGIRLR